MDETGMASSPWGFVKDDHVDIDFDFDFLDYTLFPPSPPSVLPSLISDDPLNIQANNPLTVTHLDPVSAIQGGTSHFIQTDSKYSWFGNGPSISETHEPVVPSVSLCGIQTSHCAAINFTNLQYGGVVGTPVPPSSTELMSCQCCSLLRELIHSDGTCATKLSMYGKIGTIAHAILEVQKDVSWSSECHFFLLNDKTFEEVKLFLHDYCTSRVKEGFVIMSDSLASYYDAIGARIDLINIANSTFPMNAKADMSAVSGNHDQESGALCLEREEGESTQHSVRRKEESTRNAKLNLLSVQRSRTKQMTLEHLKPYFHLPIKEAAEKLQLCPTVVKNLCRRSGLRRWPYRKVCSFRKQLQSLQVASKSGDADNVKTTNDGEMKRIRREIELLYATPSHSSSNNMTYANPT